MRARREFGFALELNQGRSRENPSAQGRIKGMSFREGPNDKPEGTKLGWSVTQSEILHRGQTSAFRRDQIRIHDKQIDYEYEERAAAVIIVPVTCRGEIVLIRQYRYPVDAWCLETPAGGCHDVGGLPLEEVVRKELREEIGAEAGALQQAGWFFTAPSFSDEKAWIYLAWDVELSRKPKAEQSEEIQIRVVAATEALVYARHGELVTAPCALALLRCEELIRNRFPREPQRRASDR